MSHDQAILEVSYVQESGIRFAGRTLGPILKNHTVKLLEMTEAICCYYDAEIIIMAQFSLHILRIKNSTLRITADMNHIQKLSFYLVH